MKIPYFPGCTLYNKASRLDNSTRASLAALGVELVELPQWTCCGAVFPLAGDNYMEMVAPARILADAAKEGDRLATVCSFCFNILKRVNHTMQNDTVVREKLNNYLETDYQGEVRVQHPLQILKNDIGIDIIKGKIVRNLTGLKVACYYGCMLVRPFAELDLDNPENPMIMDELFISLGAEVIDHPNKTTCCGSYQVLNNECLTTNRGLDIIKGAAANGADIIVTTCPLCQFNLDRSQQKAKANENSYRKIPIIYFTELLGTALDLPVNSEFIKLQPS
ncbi:heterodisulfide reductase subunit B [Desulfotomaculum arcticum]|uniref:Heterodisulfide reductase subunit B n=1 Tax=Desulfotruncus arcticus DSM 17038 TaxID=1121424 RepID=A0A1I2WMN5_9FIRM|nr:CoB--CoM heterodisulfide reductase iron-sulfur subunit B family protein [Desulfotruncus arcticus]SFH02535.1 heterodisulfide reductase subunit B [Desulfotomaculum arcticum] [Desulfotruncus arcticus DSM 17038]